MRDVSLAMPSGSSSSSSSVDNAPAAASSGPVKIQFPLPPTARVGIILTVAVPLNVNASGAIKVLFFSYKPYARLLDLTFA
jgi:hypothetical protein